MDRHHRDGGRGGRDVRDNLSADGATGAQDELVWRFHELADRQGRWTVFYQVSGDRLPLYLDLGLAPLKLGEEARVPLADFSLEGSQRASLRQVHRRAQRDGAVFQVIPKEGVDELMPKLKEISDAWLADKATAEKGFSVGASRRLIYAIFRLAWCAATAIRWPSPTFGRVPIKRNCQWT